MLDRLLRRVHDTKHGTPVLRGYLWWGVLIRGVLLVALRTLLLEGNVLAEWLLTLRVPSVSQEDVGELTIVSYGVILGLLTVGAGARWQLLRRIDATNEDGKSTETPAAEGDSTAGE